MGDTLAGAKSQGAIPPWLSRSLKGLLRPRLVGAPHPQLGGTAITDIARSVGHPLRVAVVRADGIGDWVLTIPLLQALESSASVETLALVAPPGLRTLLQRDEQVEFVAFSSATSHQRFENVTSRVGQMLGSSATDALLDGKKHAGRFDLVVVPRWDTDFGQNARAWAVGTGALLAGHDPASSPATSSRERREGNLLAVSVRDPRPAVHEVEHLKALMGSLGLDADIPADYGRRYFGLQPVVRAEHPVRVVMHVSAVERKREWPVDHWRRLVDHVLRELPGSTVTLVGGPTDLSRHAEILSGFGERARTVAASTPLGELPALLDANDLFIGSDSGPAHIAGSIGLPVVVVSPHPADGDPAHANSPTRFRPGGDRTVVVQPAHATHPCGHYCASSVAHCIAQVSLDDVVKACRSVLAET